MSDPAPWAGPAPWALTCSPVSVLSTDSRKFSSSSFLLDNVLMILRRASCYHISKQEVILSFVSLSESTVLCHVLIDE